MPLKCTIRHDWHVDKERVEEPGSEGETTSRHEMDIGNIRTRLKENMP